MSDRILEMCTGCYNEPELCSCKKDIPPDKVSDECDECNGSGFYYINDKRRRCICTPSCLCGGHSPNDASKNTSNDTTLAEQFKERVLKEIREQFLCWAQSSSGRIALKVLESTVELMDVKGGVFFDRLDRI
jgi:hypothetical protein